MIFCKRAKDNPNWTEEWTPPPDRSGHEMLARIGDCRELALRQFLAGEIEASKTTVERQLLAGLLQDVPGTLKRIG